jgi:hypothetical protein
MSFDEVTGNCQPKTCATGGTGTINFIEALEDAW